MEHKFADHVSLKKVQREQEWRRWKIIVGSQRVVDERWGSYLVYVDGRFDRDLVGWTDFLISEYRHHHGQRGGAGNLINLQSMVVMTATLTPQTW